LIIETINPTPYKKGVQISAMSVYVFVILQVLTWGPDILKRLHINLYATVRPQNMTDKLFNKMNAKEKGFQCSFQKLFLSVSLSQILPQHVQA
jgi:hypothetical protein